MQDINIRQHKAKEDMRPNATTWYFKPVRYLGRWSLCLKDKVDDPLE